MSTSVIVTIDDVRAVGLCVNGSRTWFERHGLDFRAFLRKGLDAETLLATNDAMALRVVDGWIVGSNRGEWGGELVFISDSGDQQIIADTNVEDVHLLGDRVVAVTGLAHLGISDGDILQLSRSESGVWTSTPWRSLPGAPQSSTLVETGELLVNVANGGSVLISDDGVMRMVPCKDG